MDYKIHSPNWSAHSTCLRFRMKTLVVLVLIATLCGILSADPIRKPTPKRMPTSKPITTTTTTTTTTTAEPSPNPTQPAAPAYCRAIWLFTDPCAEINSTLIQQVRLLSPNAGCADCNYLFVSADNVSLTVDHSSADGYKAETIIFKYGPTRTAGGCRVFIQSLSTGPHTVLDNDVNYCNIYNLLTGSGLDLQPGFSDKTNEWLCPAFNLVPCNSDL